MNPILINGTYYVVPYMYAQDPATGQWVQVQDPNNALRQFVSIGSRFPAITQTPPYIPDAATSGQLINFPPNRDAPVTQNFIQPIPQNFIDIANQGGVPRKSAYPINTPVVTPAGPGPEVYRSGYATPVKTPPMQQNGYFPYWGGAHSPGGW